MDQARFLRLAQGEYLNKIADIRITESRGVGKGDLATALGWAACTVGYRVRYYTTRLPASIEWLKSKAST